MNIVIINTCYNKGGAAHVAMDIKNYLDKTGHKTTFFVGASDKIENNIFKIKPTSKVKRVIQKISGDMLELNNSEDIISTPAFKEADIIHCHNLHGGYFDLNTLAKIDKLKPVIWTLHDMWPITDGCFFSYQESLADGFYKCAENRALITKLSILRRKNIYQKLKNTTLVSPSLWLKEKIERSFLKDRKIVHIPNGISIVDYKRYDKIKARQELNLPQDKKIIMFLAAGGKDDKRKGWEYVEEMIKKYQQEKNVLFLCVGGTNELKTEKVNYIEYINDKGVLAKYFSAVDIFLFTSLAENMPLVILEAMACGTPIVSFNVGGVKEVAQHLENGYIARYKDTEDLYNGINYILNLNNDGLESIAKKSIAKIKEGFTDEKMAEKYLKLYKEITSRQYEV